MATYTKSSKGFQGWATWACTFTSNTTNINVTSSTFSINALLPTVTGKITWSGLQAGRINAYLVPIINGSAIWTGSDWYTCTYYSGSSTTTSVSWANNASKSIPLRSTGGVLTTSSYFNSSNKTSRTLSVTYGNNMSSFGGYAETSGNTDFLQGDTVSFNFSQTITLDAPPTYTATTTSSGVYYANISTYSVNISNLSAKYGGTISSAVLNVGGVTASRNTNGALSVIVPSASGTYTPTVTVTDSRGQVTTTSLTAIIVESHALPTLTSTVTTSEPYYNVGDAYSVSVSNIQTYEGASVSSVTLVLGSQSDAKTSSFEGTYTINPNTVGTFIPKVVITDTYGATAEYPLPQITVQQYADPSVSFGVIRTDGNGVKDDEGESAVITATFSWTSDVTNLTAPTVVATDLNGNVQVSSTTWYTSWTSGGGVSGAISDWSSITSMPVYGLVKNSSSPSDLFNRLESYYVSVTPHDSIPRDGSTVTQTLGSAFYTIDFLAGGHGIAFGEPIAESELYESVGGTSAPTFVTNTYYETVTTGAITNYELLVNEPSDWSTNWTDYYIKVHDGLFKCNMDMYLKDIRVPNIFISTSNPTSTDGENGDVWIKYTPTT